MKILLFAIILAGITSAAFSMQLDLENPNGIAALWVQGQFGSMDMIFLVCADGTGYSCYASTCNEWVPFNPSPVPLSEVAEWTPWVVYTGDGRWFRRATINDSSPWEEMGVDASAPPVPPCFTPVPTDGQSLGDVKSMFR